jgi:hypothetical protein
LGRFFHVGGKRETRLSRTVPGRSNRSAKRAFVVGVTLPVWRVAVYCFHSLPRRGTLAFA